MKIATPTAVMSKENVSSQEDSQPDRRILSKAPLRHRSNHRRGADGRRCARSARSLDPSIGSGRGCGIYPAGGCVRPAGGEPMKFAIVEDKKDKWSRYKDVPVGAVYL